MRFYIATGLSNFRAHQALTKELTQLGWELTYNWCVHGSVQDQGEARIRSVAVVEAAGVAEAEVVIVILPGGRGTHTEQGMGMALGKHIYIVDTEGGNFDTSSEPVKRTWAFYFMPNVVRIDRAPNSKTGGRTWKETAELIVESEAGWTRLLASYRKGKAVGI